MCEPLFRFLFQVIVLLEPAYPSLHVYDDFSVILRLWFSGLICSPEDGRSVFLCNVAIRPQDYTVSQPTRSQSERSPPWKSQKSYRIILCCTWQCWTIILPVVLYGCETWSLTLREEHRLRVFENRVLRRIFGPKRDEVTWGWRKLHNDELHNLYSSPSIIRMIKSRRMRWAWHIARMGRRRMHIGYW
jgi:hypothetical protein